MKSGLKEMAAKAGGYARAAALGVMSVLLVLAAGKAQAAEAVRLFDGSFAATSSWGQSAVFTPPL